MAILLRMSEQIVEILSLRKRLLKFGDLYKVLVFWQFRGQVLHENIVFAPNPSSNLKIKFEDSKECEISKSTLGVYFEIF